MPARTRIPPKPAVTLGASVIDEPYRHAESRIFRRSFCQCDSKGRGLATARCAEAVRTAAGAAVTLRRCSHFITAGRTQYS